MTDDISEQLVDALNASYGAHPGHRAAHAKGVLCAGTFVASPEAARISRAPHLQGLSRVFPTPGEPTISDDEAATRSADYLRDALEQRFDDGQVGFRVEIELAAPDDPLDDPTALWPDGLERVHAGDVELTALAFDR